MAKIKLVFNDLAAPTGGKGIDIDTFKQFSQLSDMIGERAFVLFANKKPTLIDLEGMKRLSATNSIHYFYFFSIRFSSFPCISFHFNFCALHLSVSLFVIIFSSFVIGITLIFLSLFLSAFTILYSTYSISLPLFTFALEFVGGLALCHRGSEKEKLKGIFFASPSFL